jgi:hypothetical protein
MRVRKVCAKGHVFHKTPGCSSCPRCEAARQPVGFLADIAAPARRAPNAIARLRASLEKDGLSFNKK